MTLRKKTLLISIVITFLLISLINASTRIILLKNITDLEEKYCLENVRRASNVFEHEKRDLLTKANDYAVWDETYTFVQGNNPDFMETNFTPGVMVNLNINFAVVLSGDKNVIASTAFNLVDNHPENLPVALIDRIANEDQSGQMSIDSGAASVIIFDQMPIILASHSISTSLGTGRTNGTLVLGRNITDEFTKNLADITQSSIRIEPYQNSNLAQELLSADHASSSADIFLGVFGNESIAGYTLINDFSNKPVIILRTIMERDIFNQSYNTILVFISVVFVGCLFALLIAVLLLDKQVISRITKLSQAVIRVRLSGKINNRVQVTGKDEITFLGDEINQMLHSLETSDSQLRKSRDELEKRVEDRTAELTQVNEELTYEISERELGQQALTEAYDEISLILSSIPSILIGLGSERRVFQWNNAAENLFKLSLSEVQNKLFFSLPINWDWAAITQAVDKCTHENCKVRLDDFQLLTVNANPRILGITLMPLAQKNEAKPGLLIIGSDNTERLQLEHQVSRKNKLESIGQLAAGVAHEINTPTQLVGSNLRFLGKQLGPVINLIDKYSAFNQTLLAGNADQAALMHLNQVLSTAHIDFFRTEAPKAIEQSLEGIDRIAHIVAAMRFFMHPGSETKEPANLNLIIENALSLSRNEWKNVAKIITDFDADLPAVDCLPSDISQVILIMIINAVHAIQDCAREDSETLGEICIKTRQFNELAEISISDTGIGIPEENREKIFDLFFTTKDVGRGTGQGLAIAYTVIVKKHGGSIDLKSEVGAGTTFFIRIPVRADDYE